MGKLLVMPPPPRTKPLNAVLTQLDTAIHTQENVVTFDVTVNNGVLMQECQGLKALHMQHEHIKKLLHYRPGEAAQEC